MDTKSQAFIFIKYFGTGRKKIVKESTLVSSMNPHKIPTPPLGLPPGVTECVPGR